MNSDEILKIITTTAPAETFQEILDELFISFWEANDCVGKEFRQEVIMTHRTFKEFLKELKKHEKN